MLTLKFREYFIGFFNLEISFHTETHLKFLNFKAVSIMVIETAGNKLYLFIETSSTKLICRQIAKAKRRDPTYTALRKEKSSHALFMMTMPLLLTMMRDIIS